MKPFVFKTSNNNHYLYAPEIRKFIFIPEKSFYSFKNNDIVNDKVLSVFQQNGYLSQSNMHFDRLVKASEIEYAFINIPQIVFEVTTQCNFKCKYCCFGENYQTFSDRKSGILKFESAKILLDTISHLMTSKLNTASNTPLVISFYGGEPLLNISLIKRIVSYAKTLTFKNRILRFSLTTNGTYLAQNIDFLKENNFSLLVSLDGDLNNSAYRVFKDGKPTFQRVVENLSLVKEKYPEYFQSIRYNAVFTNLSDIEKLLNFFQTTFGKTPTISPLHFSDGDSNSPELESMQNKIPNASKSLLADFPTAFLEFPIHKKLIQLLMYMTDSMYYNELSFIQTRKDHSTFPTHTCLPFTKRLFLSVDDSIMPCEKVSRHKPFANIKNKKLEIDFEYIAEHFNEAVKPYKDLCSSCAMELLCNHCAYTSSKINGCPEYKSFEMLEKTMGELFSYIENNSNVLKSIFENIILK